MVPEGSMGKVFCVPDSVGLGLRHACTHSLFREVLLESVALEVYLLPCALLLSHPSAVIQQQLSRVEKLRVRDAGGRLAC